MMRYQKIKSALIGRCGIIKISLFVQLISYISITFIIFNKSIQKKICIKWIKKKNK